MPRSLPRWIEFQHAFVLAVAAARGAQPGEQPSVDRCDVGRLETQRRSQIVVRLRIARGRFHAFLRERNRLGGRLSELRCEIGRRLLQVHLRARKGAKVVIHRHGAAHEEHALPQDRSQRPVRPRVTGGRHDGTVQQLHRLFVIQVVGELEGIEAKIRRARCLDGAIGGSGDRLARLAEGQFTRLADDRRARQGDEKRHGWPRPVHRSMIAVLTDPDERGSKIVFTGGCQWRAGDRNRTRTMCC